MSMVTDGVVPFYLVLLIDSVARFKLKKNPAAIKTQHFIGSSLTSLVFGDHLYHNAFLGPSVHLQHRKQILQNPA